MSLSAVSPKPLANKRPRKKYILYAESEEGIRETSGNFGFFQIICQEDVIRTFFNQMIEFAIEDMLLMESQKDHIVKETNQEPVIVKDYKDLQPEDLQDFIITAVEDSKVTLTKSSSLPSVEKKLNSNSSKMSTIYEETSEKKISTSSSYTSLEEEKLVRIIFTTGNMYEGEIAKRIMNGKGKYWWSNGTVYEGEFVDGFPTGKGEMTFPDLSHYDGYFNYGLFDGAGFLNIVSTPTFYSGHWKHGQKHGQGWLLYEPADWYEGEWLSDLKEGFGVRYYKNGAKYRGMWRQGKPDGEGIMLWENNDYYKGLWSEGVMHGEGEYIWKAFYNRTFSFPVQNMYKGTWNHGKRCGKGIMYFGGDTGARLKGTWNQDFKHGDGCMVCGNGLVVDQHELFHYDKPVHAAASSTSLPSNQIMYQHLDIPVFTIPEEVDVNYYIEKLITNVGMVNSEKLNALIAFEARHIKNTIIKYLPQLNDIYKAYSLLCVKSEIHHKPVLIRLFLWKLYRDKQISKLGISLIDTDNILAENPKSGLESEHYPFEPIYFWQFLMSLVGVALLTCSLENYVEETIEKSVSAFIFRQFLEEFVFVDSPIDKSDSLLVTYVDLVPIRSVYLLYLSLGEFHTARTFLTHTCTRKGELPLLCYLELLSRKAEPKFGKNMIALTEHFAFMNGLNDTSFTILSDEARHGWTSLFDFRHLGPKNVLNCLSEICPLITEQGIIVNIDYPLTFLEFYETLLHCVFMVLELEFKKEKTKLLQDEGLVQQKQPGPKLKGKHSTKVGKVEKKSGKSKKK